MDKSQSVDKNGAQTANTFRFSKCTADPSPAFAAVSTVFNVEGEHVVFAAPNGEALNRFLLAVKERLVLPRFSPKNFQRVAICNRAKR